MEKVLYSYPSHLYSIEVRNDSFSIYEGSGDKDSYIIYLYSNMNPVEFIKHLDSINYLLVVNCSDNLHNIIPKKEILYISELSAKEKGERKYTYDGGNYKNKYPQLAYKHIVPPEE